MMQHSTRGAASPAARRLLWVALFLTFDLIMFGAFVRIADAGLGCPDWPGCYGQATPFGAIDEIRAAAAEMPHGPVTVFKAWVEMLHRYIAAGLGVLIIGIAWLAWRERRAAASPAAASSAARLSLGLALITLAWVILQGLFGMWTVTLKLRPAVVTAHLLGAMVLFALLLLQTVRVVGHPPVAPAAARLRGVVLLAIGLVLLQIALGGWVSTNYATLACQDFPRCQGSWWPDMNFAAGFTVWRPLGRLPDDSALPFQALTAIHYVHRLNAYLVVLLVGWLAWRIRRLDGLRPIAGAMVGVVLAQFATGLTTIFLDWPAAAAVLHTGGATALLASLLMLNFRVAHAAGIDHPARAGHAARAGHVAGAAGFGQVAGARSPGGDRSVPSSTSPPRI